jgi:hypothetical protein
MARLSNKIAGAVANVIIYEFREKLVSSSKPKRVKQTKACKAVVSRPLPEVQTFG